MIDLILIATYVAVFALGFKAGALFGKLPVMWTWMKSFLP